jgi:PAS domain S-box-containing protein
MPGNDTVPLDQALAGAGDGVFVTGGDGRIRLWNRAAETILGYRAREVVGRPCCDVFGGLDDHGNRLCYPGCHIVSLVRMGEPVQSFDMRTRTRSGQGVWLNVSVLAAPDGQGGAPVTIHLFRDVTAARELLALVHERLAAPDGGAGPTGVLTRREAEVLRLMARGQSTRAIADALHVSRATVRNHVQNILGKLGAHSRLEAVAHATRHRLL